MRTGPAVGPAAPRRGARPQERGSGSWSAGTPTLQAARLRVARQRPTVPAAGPLEQVAGLLVARAAPFDPGVQRQLLAGFGFAAHTDGLGVRAVRLAAARLHSLARSTGTPVSLTRALQVWVATPDRQLDQALRTARLVSDPDVDALALLRALRDAYRLTIGPLEQLDPAVRWQWQRWTGRTRRRGADLLPPELTSTVLPVLPWLTHLNLAYDRGVPPTTGPSAPP